MSKKAAATLMNAYRFGRQLFQVILLAAVPAICLAGTPKEIIIYLVDGGTEQGTVLQITDKFIKIDPPGAILVRTIQADKIESVEFVGTGERLSFPLAKDRIPGDLQVDPRERQARRSDGLRPFAITFLLGRSATGGDYYEGIGAGLGFEIGGKYRFSQDNPYGSSFFVGMSYRYSAPGLDEDRFVFENVDVVFENVWIHQYNIEFGYTSDVDKSDSYMYLLTGLSVVDTKATGHAEYSGYRYPSITHGDTRPALRILGGGVIGINKRIGIDIRLGWDFLFAKSEENEYYYNNYYNNYNDNTTVMGRIMSIDVGLVWEL
jgi:hypothetical protein